MSHRTPMLHVSIVILLLLALPFKAYCVNYLGRFTFGGYAATEHFGSEALTGSYDNDFEIISTRLFLKIEEIGSDNWQAIADIRDKNDFFEKLDAENLKLTPNNDFQVAQMSIGRLDQNKFWGGQFGRFPVPEAGSAYVDGAQIENHWSRALRTSIFAGYNPKNAARTYIKFDQNAQIQGASITYQSLGGGWEKNFYASHAYVNETYQGHVDRNYLFQNLIYQWNPDSRFITLIYVDTVPHTFVQTGFLTWQEGWARNFQSELSFLGIDVIEYSRLQSVLETLPSSPYKEGTLKLIAKTGDFTDRYYFQMSSGTRAVDNLQRNVAELGWVIPRVFGPKWDGYLAAGTRKNFTSNDTFARAGVGYYSRAWEMNFDSSYETQANVNGTTLHPTHLGIALSNFISARTYISVSGESDQNETVKILTGFFRVGYRFGNREIAPLRDGAPPRAAL